MTFGHDHIDTEIEATDSSSSMNRTEPIDWLYRDGSKTNITHEAIIFFEKIRVACERTDQKVCNGQCKDFDSILVLPLRNATPKNRNVYETIR